MLAAAKGSLLRVTADGDDARAAVADIGELIRNGFWEKE
jgi:phosphotransferase system HPr-like phosphotransfer protein